MDIIDRLRFIQETSMSYTLIKLVHIGSLIFWIGPALGSWLVLRYSQTQTGEESEATKLIYRVFFLTLSVEHIALVTLLGSGAIMAFYFGHWPAPWLQWKLMIIAIVIVPLELVDIWLGNWKLKRLVERRSNGRSLTKPEQNLIRCYHSYFTPAAVIVLPITVFVVMWLAISKNILG